MGDMVDVKPDGIHSAHDTVRTLNSPRVSLDHRVPEEVVQAFQALSQSSNP